MVRSVCASVFDQSITESFYRGLLQIKWEVEGGRLMTAFPLLLLRPYLLNGVYLWSWWSPPPFMLLIGNGGLLPYKNVDHFFISMSRSGSCWGKRTALFEWTRLFDIDSDKSSWLFYSIVGRENNLRSTTKFGLRQKLKRIIWSKNRRRTKKLPKTVDGQFDDTLSIINDRRRHHRSHHHSHHHHQHHL